MNWGRFAFLPDRRGNVKGTLPYWMSDVLRGPKLGRGDSRKRAKSYVVAFLL